MSKSSTPLITVRLRFKSPEAGPNDAAGELVAPISGLTIHRPIEQASWQLQWATAVVGFGEILRRSPYIKGWTLQQVRELADKAKQNDAHHKEFLQLVKKAQDLGFR